jgi:hypothetical protein
MTVTTIIAGVKAYIKTYTGISSSSPVWVNNLGEKLPDYSIVPLPGAGPIEEYIAGGGEYVWPFAFQSNRATADEVNRLANIGFFEAFKDWMKSQSDGGTLPELPSGKTAEKIEALGFGYLFEQGESGTGIYQVQCALTYEE